MEEELVRVLRVKRKRDQDPLQALVLKNPNFSTKRLKKDYYFKFARTDSEELEAATLSKDKILQVDSRTGQLSLLSTNNVNNGGEKFNNNNDNNDDDEMDQNQLSDEILMMVKEQEEIAKKKNSSNLVKNAQKQQLKRPVRIKHKPSEPVKMKNYSDTEYVYDVYYRGKDNDSEKYENSKIGYIRYDEELFNFLSNNDDNAGNDEEINFNDDDDDSNAEDYYQNDYPEDEDDDRNSDIVDPDAEYAEEFNGLVASDDEDDSYEISHNKKRFTRKEYLNYKEGGEEDEEEEELNNEILNDSLVQEGFDNLYNEYYGRNDSDDGVYYEGPTSFLDNGNLSEEEQEFKRNTFFKSDEDDDLAIHRDRIFGELERMITDEN
ncbi:hypothetical protein PACTADRAFT_48924 [Pachysolen tannophilus NRRL Y-2460]|uniref:Transcription factor Iwr1 domain-containing protein n=1 Tax=Pachysolen tannophilus NRRL Y-2460 TaxID=669874 RepID=A0A1E4TZK9_PACTA|nr:hypothetical protein PACTADRAFT_48924 [Pachysolen tannophilus NRRL Y-2460]